MVDVYHGTTVENAQQILRTGFKVIPKEVTNDLGNGVYTFCPDEQGVWDPQENARKYARQYKNGKVAVLKVNLDTSDKVSYVDLDDASFTQRWGKIREQLEQRANEEWKHYHSGRAKKRHNIDGILLELAIKHGMLDVDNPDFMVKCTYTSFIPNTTSNFPNGRELVIRNTKIINDKEIVKRCK
ncbi:hypothetical protein [Limosilactobacillus sp.]|uniref:hypothetical protein n=1 Tax=Limosilactobacillus sp. TaxID=2773925 RepID=UPI003F04E039